MVTDLNLTLSPESMAEPRQWEAEAAKKLKVAPSRIRGVHLLRRSVDARSRQPKFQVRLRVWLDEGAKLDPLRMPRLQQVGDKPPVHIIGMGPAGLFAALSLIEQGLKPVLLERGKPVRERRRDLALLMREGQLNPESNYCFGEGGAGTFSDGKLYTRSKKRGDVEQVLHYLVHFGATEDILIDAHPHIGTNKLPQIIANIREAIREAGGEIHFESKMTGLEYDRQGIRNITLNHQLQIPVQALLLATGHSARDIFRLLAQKDLNLEVKPFAMGVRVEHPQALIDQIQYSCQGARSPFLPAAAYNWVAQVDPVGVYSFCMCPGGIICPAATAQEEVVVNGWSPSKRNSPYANSGVVAEVHPGHVGGTENPLEALAWQHAVEKRAYEAGGGNFRAPAQRLTDFLAGKVSTDLPDCSYHPGITSSELKEVLPPHIHHALVHGFKQAGRKMKGYLTREAVVVGVESRTSSPVRIPRDLNTLMHPQLEGLFPCGEGAGYAGGIMSAALDGQRCALAIAQYLKIRT